MKKKIIASMILSVFIMFSTFSEDVFPKVAVVLSGGAALGMAHIGALKVIEEAGIPVDLVVGNSMGALVGGLYASGYSPGDLLRFAEKINWNRIFMDLNRSSTVSIVGTDRDVLTLNLDESGIFQDEGIVDDQRICSLLSRLTYRVSMVRDFDDLTIPFRTIAVDLNKGKEVPISEGILCEAMRASMGLPIVFNPIQAYGGYLIDGGVLNNNPINLAVAEGADIIISVNAESLPERGLEDFRNTMDVADQTMRIIFNINSHLEDKLKPDIVIVPDLEEFSRFDFQEFEALAGKGEEAAGLQNEEFRKLAEEIAQHRELDFKNTERTGAYFNLPRPEFKAVVFNTRQDVITTESQIFTRLSEEKLNIDAVEDCIIDFSRREDFRSLLYFLDMDDSSSSSPDGNEWILKVKGTPSERGRHELAMGIHFDLETGSASSFTGDGYLDLNMRDLTGRNSELAALLKLRFDRGIDLDVSYYQPVFSYLGVRPYSAGAFYLSGVTTYSSESELEDYQNLLFGTDLIFSIQDILDFYLGYQIDLQWYNSLGTIEEIGAGIENEGLMWDFGQVIKAGTEWGFQTNSPFSRYGIKGSLNLELDLPFDFSGSPFDSLDIYNLVYYTPEMDEIIYGDINIGHYRGEIGNKWTMYSPGGSGGIPGYADLQNIGRDKIILGFGYRKNIERLSRLLGMETYLENIVRVGNVWDKISKAEDLKDIKGGAGSGIAVETPVGNLSVGMGISIEGTFVFNFRFNSAQ